MKELNVAGSNPVVPTNGDLAQLVERQYKNSALIWLGSSAVEQSFHRRPVVGSNPSRATSA